MDTQDTDIKGKNPIKRKPRGRKIVRREKPKKAELRKGRLIGYMRVSTEKQDHALQRDALLEYRDIEGRRIDPADIFQDTISGSKVTREGRDAMLKFLVPGDTLIVWKLDRFSRSLKDILEKLDLFAKRGIGFVSLTQQIDTTGAAGRMMVHIIGAFAEFEREMIRERVKAGIQAKRSAEPSMRWGKKPSVDYDEREISKLLKNNTVRAVAKMTGVPKSTVHAISKRKK